MVASVKIDADTVANARTGQFWVTVWDTLREVAPYPVELYRACKVAQMASELSWIYRDASLSPESVARFIVMFWHVVHHVHESARAIPSEAFLDLDKAVTDILVYDAEILTAMKILNDNSAN